MQKLDLKPETALSQGSIRGMVLLCYENERPFQGVLGHLDWRFNAHFSELLKKQILTGKKGETVYAPILWNDRTLPFLIVGAGSLTTSSRSKGHPELLEMAKKKLKELNLTLMAIDSADWGLEGPGLWILN